MTWQHDWEGKLSRALAIGIACASRRAFVCPMGESGNGDWRGGKWVKEVKL